MTKIEKSGIHATHIRAIVVNTALMGFSAIECAFCHVIVSAEVDYWKCTVFLAQRDIARGSNAHRKLLTTMPITIAAIHKIFNPL